MAETYVDPMQEITDILGAKDREQKAAQRISEARALMVANKVPGVERTAIVFYTALLLRLEPVPTRDLKTMCTDGQRLWFNPEFTLGLSQNHLFGVLAHEVLHPALGHQARLLDRDPTDFNDAADLVINPMLELAGFKLPKEGRFPGEAPFEYIPDTENLSTEEVYDLIQANKPPPPPPQDSADPPPQEGGGSGDGGGGGSNNQPGDDEGQGDGEGEGKEDQQGQPGPGNAPDPGGCGGVTAPGDGSPADARDSEAKWQVAVAQAADVARSMGAVPAGLERLIGEILQPKADWRAVLREFVSKQARSDHSWSRPNRRFFQQGIYLPSLHSEELGDVVVAIDTSGSIQDRELSLFSSELQAILESYECSLTILYHDSRIQHVQQWHPSDGPLQLEPKGGGGTSHVPVFDWIAEHDTAEAPCVVCFTDMCTCFPDKAPHLPVLWAAVGDPGQHMKPPFGQVIEVA